MNIKGLFTIFFLLLLAGNSMAQSDFRPGFIVTNAGDTIHGKIDYRGDQLMGSVCRFKANEHSEIQEYRPTELKSYRFIDDKLFVSRKISIEPVNTNAFLEYLISGKLSIYYHRNENGDYYFAEKEGGELVLLPYTEVVHKINGVPYLSKSKLHIGLLKSLTKDAPVFESRIERFKKPGHNNLVRLAEDYHNVVCKEEKCIVYEKKIPFLKVSVEPLVGYVKYKEVDDLVGEYGANLYLWLPRGNEKLYLKTGYLLNKFSVGKNTYRLSKIPVQLQYIYPSKAFRPKVNVGINFYRVVVGSNNADRFHTVQVGTGFNYKLYKGLFLSTNVSTELTPLSTHLFSENSALSGVASSFNIGLYFSL